MRGRTGGRAGRGGGKAGDKAKRGRGGGGRRAGGGSSGRAAGVAVDPRMRSRRIRVRRSEGRRRLRRITLGLAAAAALVAVAVATQTSALDVDHVRVTGVDGGRAGEVEEAAGVVHDQPLVSLDAGAVARRVEDLPWVASAQVSRSWPATVRIDVSPRRPVAKVQVTDDRVALVDAEGVVVSIETVPAVGEGESAGGPAGAEPGAPLVLTGIEGPIAEGRSLDEGARDAIAVASAVTERLPDTVASVSTALDAELVQGGVVRFGSTEDLAEKVTAVKTVLSEVDTTCMAVLDVRVPGSPALTRNQGCS